VISTNSSTDRGIALGTSIDAAGCRMRSAATVANAAANTTVTTAVISAVKPSVDHRITAELRASSYFGGQVWLRPATLDVLVPTTPGHLAWSPPT
jgi:hypothetical protein